MHPILEAPDGEVIAVAAPVVQVFLHEGTLLGEHVGSFAPLLEKPLQIICAVALNIIAELGSGALLQLFFNILFFFTHKLMSVILVIK